MPGNIAGTIKWVNRMSPRGFTNPRDALKHAFGQLKPSTIWLLSDGKFSSFKRVKNGHRSRKIMGLPAVPKLISELNKDGNVRINTIGFADSEDEVDSSLKNIAKENGGAYRFIRAK